MNFSLELYRVFYMVAKNKSFSKAAEALFVSQSAVSQSVKTLESKLGFPLLLRTTKKVSLTASGEFLYLQLEEVFALLERVETGLQYRQNSEEGEVLIAATDTLCKYFLLPKIKELARLFPRIKIKIFNSTSSENLAELSTAKIDFAVLNFPDILDESRFRVEKSYPFQDVFIASSNYPVNEKINFSSLSTHPLLLLDQKSFTRKFLDMLFLERGFTLVPEIELQSIDILLEMTKMGLGISFVPDFCLIDDSYKKLTIDEEIPKRKFGILSLKKLPLTPVAKTFLSIFEDDKI